MNKKTILIVDDTETNLDILLDILKNYDTIAAIDGETALEIAIEEKIDLILLDIAMPKMNGFEVCQKLKSNELTKKIPVIFSTAYTDEDSIEKAFDCGGVDYITKPFMPKEILARVKTQLNLVSLITDLEFISFHDSLTGVYNRRKFFELATKKFETRNPNMFGVMIDIDHFKQINDKYGHDVGDKVIIEAAEHIKNFISDDSVFGRIGGEEFAIICSCEDTTKLQSKLDLLREEIEALQISTLSGNFINFTISAGVSKMSDEFKNIDQLLKKADEALYKAKNTGRNKTVIRSN